MVVEKLCAMVGAQCAIAQSMCSLMYEDCGRLFELGECASLAVYYLQNLLQKLEWVACIKSRRSRADEISEYIRLRTHIRTK